MATAPSVSSGSPHIYTHPEVPEAFVVDTDRNGIDGDDKVCLTPYAGTLYLYRIPGRVVPRWESVVDQETLDSIGHKLLKTGWERTETELPSSNLYFDVSGIVPKGDRTGLRVLEVLGYLGFLGGAGVGTYGLRLGFAPIRNRPSTMFCIGVGLSAIVLGVLGGVAVGYSSRRMLEEQKTAEALATVR